jgi:GNAT superfamily N-acetyltransferase
MVTVERYRNEDRDAVHALFRATYGENANANLARWHWQYERNPNLADGVPLIWLLRLDGHVIGQYATMPVRLAVNGREIDAAWGMDVVILPEHQRRGYGRVMFEKWDQNTGAAIGIGLTDASAGLFKKMEWHDMGRVPRLVKPLAGLRGFAAKWRPLGSEVREVRQFDDGVTRLWERVSAQLGFAVRRDAAYLNWKLFEPPHLKYTIATYVRNGDTHGYVAIRHVEQNGKRVTLLADFFADPNATDVLPSLLRWVDRQAIAAQSELVRVFSTHAGFADIMRSAGYEDRDHVIRFVAKVNAIDVPSAYYDTFASWHVTVGDSDLDR